MLAPSAPEADALPRSNTTKLTSLQGNPTTRTARERRRKLVRELRRGIFVLLLIGGGVGVALALRPKPIPVDTAQAVRGPLVVAVEEAGVTRVKDRYVVSAPVSAKVARSTLEAGDPVTEGSVLSELSALDSPLLDPRARAQAEAEVGAASSSLARAGVESTRAAAALEQSQREFERTQKLVASAALADQALSQARFELRMREQEHASSTFSEKVAREQLRLARATLGTQGKARASGVDVRAPVSGTVLRVNQKSEGVVQIGTPLFELGDPRSLEVVVDLLTTDAVHVTPSTPVQITGWGGEQRLSGVVRRVEPSAFTRASALGVDEQRVNVVVTPSDAPERWAAIGDGYRVQARIELWRSVDVLQVPHGAVFRYGDAWAVFVVEDGRARRQRVEIGHRGDTTVEVISGLRAGDQVAVHPSDRVNDGAAVAAHNQ